MLYQSVFKLKTIYPFVQHAVHTQKIQLNAYRQRRYIEPLSNPRWFVQKRLKILI